MDYSYDFPKSKFYQALITGFFVGFCATVLFLAYNIIYRDATGFPLSTFINVSTIIFMVNLIFPAIGIIYYGFITAFKKADLAFIILFVVLTAILLWRSEEVHRTGNHLLNKEFRTLLSDIVIILGISHQCSFRYCFIAKNSRKPCYDTLKNSAEIMAEFFHL